MLLLLLVVVKSWFCHIHTNLAVVRYL